MVEPIREACPAGGFHQVRQWLGDGRQGLACRLCHKTWTATPQGQVPTYPALHSKGTEDNG